MTHETQVRNPRSGRACFTVPTERQRSTRFWRRTTTADLETISRARTLVKETRERQKAMPLLCKARIAVLLTTIEGLADVAERRGAKL